MQKLLYRPGEAAAALGIGKTKMWELLKCGEITALKVGVITVIKHDELERFISTLPAANAA